MKKNYFKTGFIFVIIILTLSGCSLFVFKHAQSPSSKENTVEQEVGNKDVEVFPPLEKDQAFKGVVEIQTIFYNSNGTYKYVSSGAIISPDGFFVANSEVVKVKNKAWDSGYIVCFTTDINKEPDCSQTAELVSVNNDFGVALLHINNSISSPYLKLADSGAVSGEVSIFGYSKTGEGTVAVIGGAINESDNKRIKIQGAIPSDIPGIVIVNEKGELFGIATTSYSGAQEEVNNITDSNLIKDWVNKEKDKYKPGAISSFAEQYLNIMIKRKNLETSTVFTSDYPDISITRPDNWIFNYKSNNELLILNNSILNNKDSGVGGGISLEYIRHANLLTVDDIIPILTQEANATGKISLFKINKEETINFSGLIGKKMSNVEDSMDFYVFPWREYMIKLSYSYGEKNKDKEVVDHIIRSLKIGNNSDPFSETFFYQSADLGFNLTSIKGWPMTIHNNKKNNPVFIESKIIKGANIGIHLIRQSDVTADFSSKSWMADVEKINQERNDSLRLYDLKRSIISTSTNFKINEEFGQAARYEAVAVKLSNNKIQSRVLQSLIRINDQYSLIAILDVVGDDEKKYSAAVADFDKIMSSLSAKYKKDSDNDGLSDEDEIKLGTDLLKSDTDGDGYNDGSEVVNGYNPLAK